MFNVQRSDFISQVWKLTATGSVVLTGSPGVGKSWTIAQLIKRSKNEGRRILALAAEDFEVNSVDELRSAIGFKTDLGSFVSSLGTNPLVIIDGLDALRGESSQKAFRDLIQTIISRASNCSIVVSIRTFDLQRSPELQRLFSARISRPFSKVSVQPFSDDDLQAVVDQIPSLRSVLAGGTTEIRELLRNPFNLRLAVELLDGGVGIQELLTVHSQVQLLQRYWLMRVESPADGVSRKAFLRQVTREMVDRKSLSIREEIVYSAETASVLRILRSAEVLRESVTDRISFSHNVIFDYAVSRLLLDEQQLFPFIASDSSRTIFFRPSILYFFHHLWWNDRELFWKVASRSFVDAQLPERVKVVPAVVVTEAARNVTDLHPLLGNGQHSQAPYGIPLTLRAVQALGLLQTTRRALWLNVLDKIADQPQIEYVNEFVALVSIASQSRVQKEESQLGSISRRLLLWMWSKAEALPKHQSEQLTSIAAGRVMPVVMQLYATDKAASRKIVETVLDRLGTPASSPHDAFWLAHEIKPLIDSDPALAVLVYQRMFGHPEQSEEITVMGGGGPVFTLTSTRKQDFETALYGLQQAFPYFVEHALLHATEAGVLAVNAEIERERESHEEPGLFTFRFLNSRATYESDFSEIWDHGAREHLSVQLLDSALRSAASSPRQIRAMVQVIARNARVAVCWKRLLETAASAPAAFFPHLRGLLRIPRFLAAPEVTIATGNLLNAAYSAAIVSDSDKKQIEAAISRISRSRIIKRYEKPESIENRLILCIGADHLVTPELRERALEVRERKERSFANEPHVKITGGAMSYSTEEWLRDQGADITAQGNVEVLAAIKEISSFEHKYLNSVPTAEESAAVEPQLRRLHELVQRTKDEHIAEHGRGVLYAVAESILKNHELPNNLPLVEFCRCLVLEGVSDPSPVFDSKYHLSFDTPSWGSPLPRIEAAQGLSHLIWNYGTDEQLTEVFTNLIRDPVPAVRYQVAVGLLGFYKNHNYDQFWQLFTEMMSNEKTPGVMLGLLETLGRIAGNDPERVVEHLTRAIDRGLPETGRSEMARTLVQILTGLYVVRANANAGEQLARFENEPIRYAGEVGDEVFTASYYLIPQNAEAEARRRARELFRRVLLASFEELRKATNITESKQRSDTLMAAMRHIDEVASRIYFSLDIKPELRRPESALNDAQRRDLYFELKPLISLVAEGPEDGAEHHLLPHTAHYVLETLNGVLGYDPEAVISLASRVVKAGSALSYQFDAMAIREVVQLVEQSLADHREALRDPHVATALGEILDIFVRAGWPEALQLTFKLDRAIR